MGREWGPSTIHGNRERGTGVLNNVLYVGRLVWNRQSFVKDPATGKRQARPNPESEWVIQEVPDLRIVDQALWDAVKARQGELAFSTRSRPDGNPLNDRRRPKHLFAGVVKCGCYGGGYSMISKDLLGCSTARNKGTCDNRVNIRRDALEASILNGLKKHLMEPELFREFCAEFTKEVNRLRIERGADLEIARRELDKISRQISQIIEAITDGMYHPSIKEKMTGLEARKAELTEKLATADEPPPLLHPSMAALYAQRIAELSENLPAGGQPRAGGGDPARAGRPGDAGAGGRRTGHRAARQPRRDPALRGGKEGSGFPVGGRGAGQPAGTIGRLSEAVARTAKDLRSRSYGGFAIIVGCGGRI